jgi:hypothetical protein
MTMTMTLYYYPVLTNPRFQKDTRITTSIFQCSQHGTTSIIHNRRSAFRIAPDASPLFPVVVILRAVAIAVEVAVEVEVADTD